MNQSPKILIVLGHPAPSSLCQSLAESYASGAKEAGASVDLLNLSSLSFDHLADPRLVSSMEPDLVRAQELIKNASHLVLVYPIWWGSTPALMKAFVDRVFTTGFAYRYNEKGMPVKLLSGRTARIMITMDAPSLWHKVFYRNSGTTWLRWATLWFSGFRVKGISEFCKVHKAESAQFTAWLKAARDLGRREAAP